MVNNSIKGKHESSFLFHSCKGINSNFSVQVIDGELAYVDHWGEKDEYNHNIEKHPNWEHAEELLESVAKYNPNDFFEIAKLLKPSSRGYKIVKSIAEKQIASCESKISKIMEEANFWRKFL